MRPGLKRKGTGRLFRFGPGQRALDISGPGFVPFDQVRVVAVHDPDQIGQFSGAFGMQPPTYITRRLLYFDSKIGEVRRQAVLEQAGFNAGGCLEHGLPIRVVNIMLKR